MLKLNVHSIIDVITNSSTVIYTYQNSEKQAKELLQEVLNMLGEEKSVDDIFCMGVFFSDLSTYAERLDEAVRDGELDCPPDFPLKDWKLQNKYIENKIKQIVKGKCDKPIWLKEAEDYYEDSWDDFCPDTALYIFTKDPKYDTLIKKVQDLLNSVTADGGRDG